MQIELAAEQIKYLAGLVDFDTTGNQDDSLYLLLMQIWNACSEDSKVVVRVEDE